MAIFNQPNTAKKDIPSFAGNDTAPPEPAREAPKAADFQPVQATPQRSAPPSDIKESLIAADLTIEGKIEGTGHVRIAGRFKGDVNVKGDLTIERGAKLNGGVRAKKVIVAGELEGNVESAERVELLDSGTLTGDLKAGSLTVAAGSKIRGHVECGWGDQGAPKTNGSGNGKSEKAERDLVS